MAADQTIAPAPTAADIDETTMANAIRALVMDAVQAANSGHPGMPMGMADVATVLFARFLKFDPSAPDWPDRDRFVLSAGHGSMLIYSLLHLTGYQDMTLDELKNFRQLGSRSAGHPEYGQAEGIEMTTGPLGQGIATAVGMALGERMMAARFGSGAVDHFTYVIAGDGDLMEGISHEAASMAGHLELGKLIVLFDDNRVCIDGETSLTVADDALVRFKAYGWDVSSADGHDCDAVAGAIAAARKSDRPSLIACRTTIAYGAPTKADSAASHGAPLGDEEIKGARKALGWPHAPFVIPDDVLATWRAVGKKGRAERDQWDAKVAALEPASRGEFERLTTGGLPDGWHDAMAALKQTLISDAPTIATRQASGQVLEVLTEAVPEMVGGSADLTGSVNTRTKSFASVTPDDFGGRYIHYGVREHAMGAAMNGLALHRGAIPYAGTFLVFSDYMRGAMRLSALMEQRVIYVLTHDSIGLGEDGPTHQPVEHLAALRAMPNLNVFRPADAVETSECWELAVVAKTTPTAMVLTRQGVPTLRTDKTAENQCARGAYVLQAADGAARVTLFATGSEVSIARDARDALQADGVPTTLVSVPCWELFADQPDDYRAGVLGNGSVRIAVEAGVGLGWERFTGTDGAFIGMTGFGASAPAPELYKHFGITADAVVAAAKSRL